MRRSCGDPVETLLKGGPCIKILKTLCIGASIKFFWDAHRKFLYEDLVSSSIQIYIETPAAAVAIISNLICYSSIATVACI